MAQKNTTNDLQFNEIEQSLVSILSSMRDIDSRVSGGIKKVKSLKISISLAEKNNPCFVVSIGMCEAHFNAYDCVKQKGSIYGLERTIYDWYQRENVKRTITSAVDKALGVK